MNNLSLEKSKMDIEFWTLIQSSVSRRPEQKTEQKIVDYLKSVNEREALLLIKEMINQGSTISHVAVKRVLRERQNVEEIFSYLADKTNIQTLGLWLECIIPKLGIKRAIALIEKLNSDTNKLAEKALYWLPRYIKSEDEKSRHSIAYLKNLV